MSDNRCSCNSGGASSGVRETICIDTNRVLDSCRDRDCYENARVYVGNIGQELLDHVGCTVRVVCTNILWTYISVDSIQFNRGFYQITARFYIHVKLEACVGMGRSQAFNGIAVVEKAVVLFGGEGNVSVFRSTPEANRCAPWTGSERSNNLPTAVVETVEPVVLGSTVVEPTNGCNCACYTCCTASDIPQDILEQCSIDTVCDNEDGNKLYVSLGLFTVFRIERPAQFLITASEYCVPDKECVTEEPSNPCSLFRNMAFPTNEFSGGCRSADETGRKRS